MKVAGLHVQSVGPILIALTGMLGALAYALFSSPVWIFFVAMSCGLCVIYFRTGFSIEVGENENCYSIEELKSEVNWSILLMAGIAVVNFVPIDTSYESLILLRYATSGLFLSLAVGRVLSKRYLYKRHIDQ